MKSTTSTSIVGQNQWINSSGYRKIQSLQDEVSYLNKIVEIKDHTLLLLDKLFKQSLSISKENIILFQNMNKVFSSFASNYFNQKKTTQKISEIRKALTELSFDYVNYYDIQQARIMKQHNQYLKILRNIGWSDYKIAKDFSLNLQNYQKNNTRQTYIYQIPVEMISHIESLNAAKQSYPLQTPFGSEQNQYTNELLISQVARPITSQLIQIPVEINHTHQIEVHMIKVQEIPTEMVQIREVPTQLLVIHEVPVQMKRQVDIPIELQMVGQQESKIDQMRYQIQKLTLEKEQLLKQNEGLKQKIAYTEQLRNEQKGGCFLQTVQIDQNQHQIQMLVQVVEQSLNEHQLSLEVQPQIQNTMDKILIGQMKTNDDLETQNNQKIKIPQSQIVSLNNLYTLSPRLSNQLSKQANLSESGNHIVTHNVLLIEEQEQRDAVGLDKQAQEQFDQFYAEQQRLANNQFQIVQRYQAVRNIIRQIPVELIIEKQIVKQKVVQAQKQMIKEIYNQLIRQTVIEREVPIYYITEIPIEVETEVIKEVPKIQYVEKIVEVQKIVQKLFEVPVLRQFPVEIIKQVAFEIIKQVKVVQYQTIIKQVPVQVYVEVLVQVPVISQIPVVVQVQKIVQVPVIKEVPIEMIIEVQKIIEKQIQEVAYKPVQKTVYVKMPVIKEIPVIMYVQKIIEVPVEVIEQVQTVIEKQKLVQKIIEKEVQKIVVKEVQKIIYQTIQKPVYIEIPVIKQIPVQIITQIQKKVFVKIPYIKEIPVQIIHEIPVEFIISNQDQEAKQFTLQVQAVQNQNEVKHNVQQALAINEQDRGNITLQLGNRDAQNTQVLRQIYQIPVQVVQEKIIDWFIEIEKITQITTTDYIQIKQIIEVQKKKFVPIIVQIPVQLQNNNSEIKPQNICATQLANLDWQSNNQLLNKQEQPQSKEQEDKMQEYKDQLYNKAIVEVPIQCFIEVEKQTIEICQVPVFCQIQKIVEVQKIIQVEKIIQVQKIVQVERLIQVQVQRIVEVQKLVEIVKVVQVQKIVQVPIYEQVEKIVHIVQQKIVEVPVEVIVQIIKEVPVILEMPVELHLSELSQPTIIEVPVEMNLNLQQIPTIIQIPIELQVEARQKKQEINVIEKQVVRQVIKQVQKLVEVQKIVQVERLGEIIELQKIVQVQKIVYVDRPVEKIVQIQKIVQVIIQRPAEKIIQESSFKKQPKQSVGDHMGNQIQQKNKEIKEYQIKLNQENVEIQISYPHRVQNLQQIQIAFPKKQPKKLEIIKELVSQEVQTEEGFVLQMDLMSNIDKIQFNRMQSNSEGGMGSMLKVWEIPVELQLDYNIQQMQKNIENKYKQRITQLNNKFSVQIGQMQANIESTHKQVVQLNLQNLNLREAIQLKEQREQNLQQKLNQLEKKEETNLQFINKLNEQTNRKSEIIQRQKEESEELQQKLQQLQIFLKNPVFRQLPIEIDLSTQKQSCQVQTDDIEFLQNIAIIEIPVQIQQVENLDKDLYPNQSEDKQQNDVQSQNNNLVEVVRPQTMEAAIQTKLFSLDSSQRFNKVELSSIQYSEPHNSSKQYKQMDIVRVYDELLGSYKFKIDEASSYENNMVSGIQQAADYQNMIENNVQIYQVPLEVITEPIIYQVPILIAQYKETSETQTQTEYSIIQSQAEVVELPVQLIVSKQDSDYSYYSLHNRQKIAQNRRINDKSQKVALTDSDSNIVNRQESLLSKKKEIMIKEKHYSEYFNSRMIEIPIELEISKEHNLTERFAIVQAFQPITINDFKEQEAQHFQEDRQMKMPQEIYANIHNMQYETSFHGYDPNNTMFNDSFQKLRTPSQIAYIIHKSSPKPSKPSQNLSIATDQVNQKVKQYGLTHPEVNKKYAGFEIQQSSFQNITVTREMVIEEQSESNNSVDYKRMRSPNLQITEFNYQDHATAKQIMIELQQQRNRLLQMYEGMVSKYNKLKNEKDKVDEELDRFKIEILDSELPRLKKEISENKDYIIKLKIENQDKIIKEKAKIEDLSDKNEKLEQRIKNLIEGQQKLREDSQKIQKNLNNFITNLQDKLYTVRQDYKALRLQFMDEKDDFKIRYKEMEHQLRDKLDEIRRLEDELQTKEYKLQQLSQSHQELRKNIAVLRRNQQIDPTQIYEQEFQRVKQIFQQQKLMLSAQVQNLTHQLEMMKAENKQQQEQIAHLNRQIQQLQQHIDEAQHENSKLHHIKSQIEYNYITGVKQLEQVKNQIKEKNQLLQRYQHWENRDIVLQAGHPTTKEQAEFRIQYLSRQNSRISGIEDNGNYITNLQNLILKYQRMLIEDQQQIEEYQEKVCQYLRDALEKEQQAEGLFAKLVEYEGTVNSILVEKVTLQVQNKRLARAVQMSERKVQALSTKLIEAVRLHYDQDVQEPKYYYYR